MQRVFIKPANAELRIRHPEKLSHVIPVEGEEVTLTTEWQRYIDCGDVVLVDKAIEVKTVKGNK